MKIDVVPISDVVGMILRLVPGIGMPQILVQRPRMRPRLKEGNCASFYDMEV